jgi:hypothetical protein
MKTKSKNKKTKQNTKQNAKHSLDTAAGLFKQLLESFQAADIPAGCTVFEVKPGIFEARDDAGRLRGIFGSRFIRMLQRGTPDRTARKAITEPDIPPSHAKNLYVVTHSQERFNAYVKWRSKTCAQRLIFHQVTTPQQLAGVPLQDTKNYVLVCLGDWRAGLNPDEIFDVQRFRTISRTGDSEWRSLFAL